MIVFRRDSLLLLIYSVFIALVVSGNIAIAGLKLSIFFSFVLFFYLVFINYKIVVKGVSNFYIVYALLLVISILYAFLIDSINGDSEVSLYISISKIYIVFFVVVTMAHFSQITIKEMEIIFLKSNKIMFLINIVILFFALTPSLQHFVYDMSKYGGRLKAFSDQTNGYALLIVFNFSVAYYSFVKRKSFFSLSNLVLVVLLAVMTQSRGLVLGMFLSIFCTYLIISLVKKKQRKGFVFIMSIIITLFLGFSVMSSSIAVFLQDNFGVELARFNSKSEANYSSSFDNVSFSERDYLAIGGLKTIVENPFGVGFVNSHLKILKVTGIPVSSHNLFIETMLYYGVVFGMLWLIIFPYTIYILIKKLRSNNSIEEQSLFVLFALVMFQLVAFFMTHGSDTIYIWFFIGLAIGFVKNKKIRLSKNKI